MRDLNLVSVPRKDSSVRSAVPMPTAGHVLFAVTLVGIGILGLIKNDFTVVWQPLSKSVHAREVLVFACALMSLGSGLGLLWRRTSALATRVLLVYLLLWMLIFIVPLLVRTLTVDVYWSAGKITAIISAVWVLYALFASAWDRQHLQFATGNSGLRIARLLYGVALIPFGIAHFQYLKHTAEMVPGWLPGHVFWACFTGGAFIAAGIAVLIGLYARLAATLSALQMGMFLLFVWVPAMIKGPLNGFQWGEVVITWVLTAAAWVVADSYRGTPLMKLRTTHQ